MRKSGQLAGPGLSGNVCQTCGLPKQSFDTRTKAKKAARVVREKKLRVYRCGPYWHLTSVRYQ